MHRTMAFSYTCALRKAAYTSAGAPSSSGQDVSAAESSKSSKTATPTTATVTEEAKQAPPVSPLEAEFLASLRGSTKETTGHTEEQVKATTMAAEFLRFEAATKSPGDAASADTSKASSIDNAEGVEQVRTPAGTLPPPAPSRPELWPEDQYQRSVKAEKQRVAVETGRQPASMWGRKARPEIAVEDRSRIQTKKAPEFKDEKLRLRMFNAWYPFRHHTLVGYLFGCFTYAALTTDPTNGEGMWDWLTAVFDCWIVTMILIPSTAFGSFLMMGQTLRE